MTRFNMSIALTGLLGIILSQDLAADRLLLAEGRPVQDEELTRQFTTALPQTQDQILELTKDLKRQGIHPDQLSFEEYTPPSTISRMWHDCIKPCGKGLGILALYAALPTGVFLLTRAVSDYSMTVLPHHLGTVPGGYFAGAAARTAKIDSAGWWATHVENGAQYALPLAWTTWGTPKLTATQVSEVEIYKATWLNTTGHEDQRIPENPEELIEFLRGKTLLERAESIKEHEETLNSSWKERTWSWVQTAKKIAWASGPTIAFQYSMSAFGFDRILYGTFAFPLARWIGAREFSKMSQSFALSPYGRWIPGKTAISWMYGKSAEAEVLRGVKNVVGGIDHLAGAAFNTVRGVASKVSDWIWGKSAD